MARINYTLTGLTEEERKAFKVWCAQNDTNASEQLADFIRRKIKPRNSSPLSVSDSASEQDKSS
jgi:hypothetical protein